jgi:hypothetical protein
MLKTPKKRSREMVGYKTPLQSRKSVYQTVSGYQVNLIDVLYSPLTAEKKTGKVFCILLFFIFDGTLQVSTNFKREGKVEEEEERKFLKAWLHSLQLEHYEEILISQGVDSLAALSTLDEDTLKKIGINALGARKKILQNLRDCCFPANIIFERGNSCLPASDLQVSSGDRLFRPVKELETSDQLEKVNNVSSEGENTLTDTSREERKLYPIFYMNNQKTDNDEGLNLMERTKKLEKDNKSHPFSKRVPGTSFTVDSFKAAGQGDCRQFFLSHFHSVSNV